MPTNDQSSISYRMSPDTQLLTPDDGATVAVRLCPKCNAPNPMTDLVKSEYRCAACGFDMVYLDVSTRGTVRGLKGWVLREGDIIASRYKVTSVLGKGGFGATYLVEDLNLNGKRRALKEIPTDMFDEAEARLLSRLNHASIPDIIDRSVANDMVYLVLEFGGTRTLGSERKRLGGKIALSSLAPWAYQICKVLSYLHAQTPPIIHRDLKPDNILLDEHEHIMLIDFGIAKLANPDEATRTLGRAVSFGFSSPEQIMGSGTDQRSDIYSLGATLYFLLTGTHVPAVNAQLAGKKVEPPSKFAPDIPAVVDRAILKAIDLNPEQRQRSVSELESVFAELDRTMPRHRLHPAPHPAQSRNLVILIALLLVMLGLAAIAWLTLDHAPTDSGNIQQASPQPSPTKQIPASEPSQPRQAPVETKPVTLPEPATAQQPSPESTATPAQSQPLPPASDTPSATAPPAATPAIAPAPETAEKPRAATAKPKPAIKPTPRVRPKIAEEPKPKPAESEPDWSGSMRYEGGRRTTP